MKTMFALSHTKNIEIFSLLFCDGTRPCSFFAVNMFYFNPNIGYFFMDNLSADLLLLFTSTSQDKSPWGDFDAGFGMHYFMGTHFHPSVLAHRTNTNVNQSPVLSALRHNMHLHLYRAVNNLLT